MGKPVHSVGIFIDIKENIAGNFDTLPYFLMKQLSPIILYYFESTKKSKIVEHTSSGHKVNIQDTTVYTERPHSGGDGPEEPNDQFPGRTPLISIQSKPISPASFG